MVDLLSGVLIWSGISSSIGFCDVSCLGESFLHGSDVLSYVILTSFYPYPEQSQQRKEQHIMENRINIIIYGGTSISGNIHLL